MSRGDVTKAAVGVPKTKLFNLDELVPGPGTKRPGTSNSNKEAMEYRYGECMVGFCQNSVLARFFAFQDGPTYIRPLMVTAAVTMYRELKQVYG